MRSRDLSQEDEQALAEKYGLTCKPDPRRGGGWCSFEIGNTSVWSTGNGWTVADLVDNHWTNHKWFKVRMSDPEKNEPPTLWDDLLEPAMQEAARRHG